MGQLPSTTEPSPSGAARGAADDRVAAASQWAGAADDRAEAAFEPVIGIEIHVQLRTASKMFCGCSNDPSDAAPNARTCPVCLGLPGALPVINREAVRHVLATGMAIEATIPPVTRWDRKNYFYPDLPKGYQISQYELPLASAGRLDVETSHGTVEVGITRAHLEEDTARLVHTRLGDRPVSLLDYDRSGSPLMEVVSEPVIRDAETARRYAEELRLLLVTIGASNAAMESGQMRVEANVSLRPVGQEAFGTRVEIKNMNSFRSVERAIDYEIARQAAALRAGEPLIQETRGWDDDRGLTYHMRTKETSDDYRYFPEPDLPPLRLDPAWLEEVRSSLPELPAARRRRYREALGLPAHDADVLVNDAAATALFEAACAADPGLPARKLANWVTGEYLRLAKGEGGAGVARVSAAQLAALVRLVEDGAISGSSAKDVFMEHAGSGRPVADIVAASGLRQISDVSALQAAVDAVIAENPAAVADVRAGAAKAVGFLTGQVMKRTRGQANPVVVGELLRAALADDASVRPGAAAPGDSAAPGNASAPRDASAPREPADSGSPS
jgi:aspartyl-tRNA(Asn)/glutamyl-tRNA(Gln) amidotransferase subunit B